MDVVVRRARAEEAEALTGLVMRAKASWGYSAGFMDACRAELTMTPAKLADWTVWAAELDGRLAGLIALSLDGERAELEEFFVEPQLQGRGVGAALMGVFLDACRAAAATVVGVDADPNAEPIYARFGFVTVGRSPSASIPGRMLPRMELRLPPPAGGEAHTIRAPSLPQ